MSTIFGGNSYQDDSSQESVTARLGADAPMAGQSFVEHKIPHIISSSAFACFQNPSLSACVQRQQPPPICRPPPQIWNAFTIPHPYAIFDET
jgi:hypothetical protein